MTFKLLTGSEAINAAINSIANRGKKLRADIHKAAVSCLAHIEAHGDVTVLSKLDAALPQGANVKRMRAWAEAHGKVVFDDETKAYKFRKNSSTKIDDACAVHPFDFQKSDDGTEKAFDLVAEIVKLAERATKKEANAELVQALKALVPAETENTDSE
jgi:hypothetical protein